MSDALKPLIAAAITRPLTRSEAEAAFTYLFEGTGTAAQIAALLVVLRMRGETVDEIAAAAQIMRDKCHKINAPEGAMDIVGTGGDGKGTLNISTATALVVAGAGVVVAKHGNRNLSSQSGAADVLSHLGVEVMFAPALVERCISEVGIGFMMAPMHHPAMRHVMPVRQEMGIRTLFNILGPLTNPAGVRRQLTGAYSADLLMPMAQTLQALGAQKAWLVHGGDGTDELSISAPSQVVALSAGALKSFSVHPQEAGLPLHPFSALIGGAPAQNAQALRALLDGEKSAYRDAVLLNAAAALIVADLCASLTDGVDIASKSIDSGAAKAKLAQLAQFTQNAA